MRATFGVLLALAALLLSAVVGLQVRAASTQSFTATATISPAGAPARLWVDEDGVTHVRGLLLTGTISGDISGTTNVLANSNVDLMGNGDGFGSFNITTAQGGWQGHYSGTLTNGVFAGDFAGQGTGSLQGMKILGTFAQTGPYSMTYDLRGTVLNPHG